LVLTIGLARFAYTPLLPSLQLQTGLTDAGAGALAAVNYAGYMTGALAAAWMDDVRWRHRFYSMGLWMALLTTAAMALSAWMPGWMVLRYIGGLCGATGMLLGSGLVLGWLMRHGHRPELGLHFIGIGLGIVVSAMGAWGLSQVWGDWASQWLAMAVVGVVFFIPAWWWRPPVPPPVHAQQSTDADSIVSKRWLFTMIGSYFAAGWGFVISATFTVAIIEREPGLAGQGAWAWALVGLAAMPAVFVWDRVARKLFGAVGYGATFIGIVSLTLALVGRRSPNNPGKAMARLTLSYGVAQMVAPVVSGYMAQHSGNFKSALWLTAAVMAVGMALLATLPVESTVTK
jgi:MFS family permease